MPDAMCWLETFVTDTVLWQKSFFLAPAPKHKEAMNKHEPFEHLWQSFFQLWGTLTWQMVVMWAIGALLIYLAIAKKMEPSLLLPMGFGAILVNLPGSGAITQGGTP